MFHRQNFYHLLFIRTNIFFHNSLLNGNLSVKSLSELVLDQNKDQSSLYFLIPEIYIWFLPIFDY